ncbi:MAG: TRAP transporter small permease [Mailhella sp.]|jgi:TRAP-type C4-dicarboxylate transport system permease small subunit|nr:TRAP transporter small permease [Mailhella sp.]
MNILKKLYDNLEEIVCSATLAVMILCLSAQVLVRMCAGSSIDWTEELSRYTFIGTVFLGAALAAKRCAHVRVTAQFLWMNDKWRMFFRVFIDAVWVACLLYVSWNCIPVLIEDFEFPEISPTMNFAKAWVEMVIPGSFTLAAFRIVMDYVKRWRNGTLNKLVRFEEDV